MAWDFLSVKAEFRKFWQTLANLPRISLTCKYESNQLWIWIQSGSWPEQEYIKKKVDLKPLQELGLVWPVKIPSRNMNCLLPRFFRLQLRIRPHQEYTEYMLVGELHFDLKNPMCQWSSNARLTKVDWLKFLSQRWTNYVNMSIFIAELVYQLCHYVWWFYCDI